MRGCVVVGHGCRCSLIESSRKKELSKRIENNLERRSSRGDKQADAGSAVQADGNEASWVPIAIASLHACVLSLATPTLLMLFQNYTGGRHSGSVFAVFCGTR